jgi:serine/threonine protein kinase
MTEIDIFLALLDLPDAAARSAFLAKACAGDAVLRAQVESLLQSHANAGRFLSKPALPPVQPDDCETQEQGAQSVSDDRAAADGNDLSFLAASGRLDSLGRLGHYEVLEVLGRGGFGIVFRAFDEALQRLVAIKVLAPQLAATSAARKRFLREARASARVRHENVVGVYAIEEEPLPYLVMEFVPGESLQQRLDRLGPLEVPEVVRLGRQIAEGLAAAHATGLIHRDIKPANILLEAGPHPHVKITDFGLARAADDASSSQSGFIAGTPTYMAPEQANAGTLDHRADLFSLGSVLYAMCTGRAPFRARSTLAVLKRVAEDTPRPIREIIPEVPAFLCDLISRLHAKKPEDRFASAQEVADLLTRHLAEAKDEGGRRKDEKTQKHASDSSFVLHPSSFRGRRWAAAAAVVLMLLGGLGFTEATGVTDFRGTVIRLFSPEGTLVVELDDPGVSVKIDGAELVITGAGAREIRLKPGRYTVEARKDGKIVRRELVTVTKNGKQVVRVSQEALPPDAKAAKAAADAAAWERIATLPAAKQVEEVRKELKKRNPRFIGRIEPTLVDDRVHAMVLEGPGLQDISPLRALPGLQRLALVCPEVADLSPLRGMGLTELALYHSGVSDLSPLRGMKLRGLDLSGSRQIADLSPLRGMPLKELTIYGTQVKDLTPLKDMKLESLNCDASPVVDLSPLKGLPLQSLNVSHGQVSDLSPLKGLPLAELSLVGSAVTDLSPIKDLPLMVIRLDFQAKRDAVILRGIRTLVTINGKPAAQFWKEVDK